MSVQEIKKCNFCNERGFICMHVMTECTVVTGLVMASLSHGNFLALLFLDRCVNCLGEFILYNHLYKQI